MRYQVQSFGERFAHKKGLLFNFFHIGVLKFLNIGSKYVLVGYLIRTLGENGYGALTWIDSIVQYFIMVINFGFDLYAAKHIVENRDDRAATNEIISAILYVKTALLMSCFLAMVPLSYSDEIRQYLGLILILLLTGVGEVLTPIWYFQGIEKMKVLTVITFFTKIILIAGAFLFVRSSNDLSQYILMLTATTTLAGIWSYLMMRKEADFRFVSVSWNDMMGYLKEGYLFFLGKFSTFLFNMGTLFLIGYFFSKADVAGFDIATKIVFVFIIPFEVLQQSLFPVIVRGVRAAWLRRVAWATVAFSGAVCALLYCFAPEVMALFGGSEMAKYTYVLKMILVLLPLVSLTIILGNCIMVAKGFYKAYNQSLYLSALLFIVGFACLAFGGSLSFVNLIVLRVVTELFLLSVRVYHILKNKILFT